MWAGAREGAEPAAELAAIVEDVAGASGFAREKKAFHPHVTLARMRSGSDARALVRAAGALRPPVDATARASGVTIYTSRLTSEGAVYEVFRHCSFGP